MGSWKSPGSWKWCAAHDLGWWKHTWNIMKPSVKSNMTIGTF
jgi:hypothetical protein